MTSDKVQELGQRQPSYRVRANSISSQKLWTGHASWIDRQTDEQKVTGIAIYPPSNLFVGVQKLIIRYCSTAFANLDFCK